MKIIFLQDVRNVGKKGDIKEVSEGYALNFLLPKKLAKVATRETIMRIEAENVRRERVKKEAIALLQQTLLALKGKIITINMPSKNGKLFGSVTAKSIAEALKKDGFDVSEKSIVLKKHLKAAGRYDVPIDFGQGARGSVTVIISGD